MQSHNKQSQYINELERLKKERELKEIENKKALNELKGKIIFRKKKKSKSK